jgi:hypothetical protein
MFTTEELATLLRDEDKYDDMIIQDKVLNIDLDLVVTCVLKKNALKNLAILLS